MFWNTVKQTSKLRVQNQVNFNFLLQKWKTADEIHEKDARSQPTVCWWMRVSIIRRYIYAEMSGSFGKPVRNAMLPMGQVSAWRTCQISEQTVKDRSMGQIFGPSIVGDIGIKKGRER